jgi:tyrosine-protein kinase Etk/Wzc
MTPNPHAALAIVAADPPAAVVVPPIPTVPVPLPPEGDDGLDWRRVWNAVRRFRYAILLVTLLGSALGVAATRFLHPLYLAQATIWIDESDHRTTVDKGPIRNTRLLDPEAWVDLLRSYEVLDQVVRDQRLFLSARRPADTAALRTFGLAQDYQPGDYDLTVDSTGLAYVLRGAAGTTLETGTVGDSIGRRLGFAWAPAQDVLAPGRAVRFSVAAVRDGARVLSDDIEIHMDEEGNFLRLELRGPDPVRITAIVNAVVQRYVQVAADLKRQKVSELTKILDQQLASAQQRLTETEGSLERFGVQTITLPTDRGTPAAPGARAERDPALTGFFDLQLERDGLRRDREAIVQALGRGQGSGVSASELDLVPSVQKSPDLAAAVKELIAKQAELRALKYRYADAYPAVQRLSADIATLERETIPGLARTLVSEIETREAGLNQRLDAGSRTLRQIPPRAIEEGRLRRAVTLAENVYTTLQQRYEEAKLAEASTIPDVRILDSAVVPRRPVKNTAPRMILLGCLASLGLAVFGAVLFDRADPRVRYPEQVSRDLGLTILGTIPHLRSRSAGVRGAQPAPENVSEVVESLRGVCLNLTHAYGTAGPIVLTVTSPGAGDGKSFVTANLAHTFADRGHRVLLVDADIRRGVQHRRFGARRRPGLSDFLRGEAPLEAIVQPTGHPSLSLIGCGVRATEAPELLGSPAMAQLVTRLRNSYDIVLFDSPPLAAGIDPLIIGTLTGHLMLVLRNGHSNREMTAAKLEVVHRFPVRLLGAVLNDVPSGTVYGYYSYYLPGYEAGTEESRAVPVVI